MTTFDTTSVMEAAVNLNHRFSLQGLVWQSENFHKPLLMKMCLKHLQS